MRMKPTQGKWHGLPGTHTFPSAGSGDAIYEEASSPATASGGVCFGASTTGANIGNTMV